MLVAGAATTVPDKENISQNLTRWVDPLIVQAPLAFRFPGNALSWTVCQQPHNLTQQYAELHFVVLFPGHGHACSFELL